MTLTEQKNIYPQLLLRNYGVLAFLAGLVSVRCPYPGLLGLALLLVLGVVQKKKPVHVLFFCLCFGAALVYGQIRSPVPPAEPLWLTQAMGDDDPRQRPLALYVAGKVAETDVYADGRVRLILNNVVPVPPPQSLDGYYDSLPAELRVSLDTAQPYVGNMAVTLWQTGSIPLAGQTVAFNGRFARVRGFANADVFTIDSYWHDREVWIRGWNIRGKSATDVSITGEPHFFAGLRNALWRDFVLALPAMGGLERENRQVFHPETLSALRGTGQAFLPALIFGDRAGITPHQKDLLSRATLTHSIALSGLHLAYVGFIGIGLAFAIGRFWPAIVLAVPRPKLCFLITLPLALLYLWIGGAPLSLLRSALMLFFFGMILFGNRTKVLVDGLFAAVFLIALVWPWALFDLSLQLSALSVGAIALSYPLVTRFARVLVPPSPAQTLGWFAKDRLRAALSLLLMSFCIQIVLSPLLVKTFGAVGLWFPLNLVWLPVLGTVVMPLTLLGFFSVCCGWTMLAEILLQAASLPCQWLMDLLEWMDRAGYLAAPLVLRPHWLAVAGIWLFLVLLPPVVWHGWRVYGRKSRARKTLRVALAGCACSAFLAGGMTLLAYYRYDRQDVSLTMLDVGHGQAVVIAWPGGRALVDGGGFPRTTFDVGRMVVAPYLTAEKPAQIDWLINSHPDYDHLGGMLHILEGFTITRGFAYNGDGIRNTLHEDFQRIAVNKPQVDYYIWRAGDYIALWDEPGNELGLEVLWPPAEKLATPEELALSHGGGKLLQAQGLGKLVDLTQSQAAGQQEPEWEQGAEKPQKTGPQEPERRQATGQAQTRTPPEYSAKAPKRAEVQGDKKRLDAMARASRDTVSDAGNSFWGLAHAADDKMYVNTIQPFPAGVVRESAQERKSAAGSVRWKFGGISAKEENPHMAGAATALRAVDQDLHLAYTGNDASLVLRLVWRGKGLALLCGDIGKKGLRHFLANTPAEAMRAEILVLPHHGSKSSFSKALYEAVDPETVLVSCAYKNSWGFPNKAIVETLNVMGKPLYSTAAHGMVKVVWPFQTGKKYLETARLADDRGR